MSKSIESFDYISLHSRFAGQKEATEPVRLYGDGLFFASFYPMDRAGCSRLILDSYKSLPLSSRTTEEVFDDQAIETAFQASVSRSQIRRQPKRYESKFVVDYLDELADAFQSLGERAVHMA